MSSLDLEFDGRTGNLDWDSEPGTQLLERRWFAALAATRGLQAECDLLFEALTLADAAWRRAKLQLEDFEALRDVLEDQLATVDAPMERGESRRRSVMSAA